MFIEFLIYNDNLVTRKIAKSVVTNFTENFVVINTKRCSAETISDSGVESEIDEEAQQIHTKICMHSG